MPSTITTWAGTLALAARGERLFTPCGDGHLVWQIWGDGRPTLLLHGGSGSWNHWVRNIEALLEQGRQVVAPDLPGFGDSAAPPDLRDADGQVPLLEPGAVQRFGDTAFDVVGFSVGALTAALWAQAHPARVARLVLVGAPALSDERLAPLPLRLWERTPPGPARDAIHRHNLRTLMLAHDAAIDDLAVALHAANLVRDRLRRRRLMLTDLLARTLPELSCPVAGLWGAEDALYRDRHAVIERALATARDCRSLTFIPNAGHWVQYEAPEAFNRALHEALRQ
jgi:2-hydroxy-6-oxonona-2,4-dienedioate hydrolase